MLRYESGTGLLRPPKPSKEVKTAWSVSLYKHLLTVTMFEQSVDTNRLFCEVPEKVGSKWKHNQMLIFY